MKVGFIVLMVKVTMMVKATKATIANRHLGRMVVSCTVDISYILGYALIDRKPTAIVRKPNTEVR